MNTNNTIVLKTLNQDILSLLAFSIAIVWLMIYVTLLNGLTLMSCVKLHVHHESLANCLDVFAAPLTIWLNLEKTVFKYRSTD